MLLLPAQGLNLHLRRDNWGWGGEVVTSSYLVVPGGRLTIVIFVLVIVIGATIVRGTRVLFSILKYALISASQFWLWRGECTSFSSDPIIFETGHWSWLGLLLSVGDSEGIVGWLFGLDHWHMNAVYLMELAYRETFCDQWLLLAVLVVFCVDFDPNW